MWKTETFQRKFTLYVNVYVRCKQRMFPVNKKIIKNKSFLIKSWLVSSMLIGLGIKGIGKKILWATKCRRKVAFETIKNKDGFLFSLDNLSRRPLR